MDQRRFRPGWRWRYLATQLERPEQVAALRKQQPVAARHDGDVLLAIDFKLAAGTFAPAPVLASTASTLRTLVVTYITPATTTGVASRLPS
jgi:hypothetical protein